jgi:polyferredoxin
MDMEMKNLAGKIHDWGWIVLIAFLVVGLIYPQIGLIALICMLAPVLTAFFRGRLWCGKYCPRGSFSDKIISKVSLNKPMPKFLSSGWFRNTFLVFMLVIFSVQIVLAWGDYSLVGAVFVRMIIITTLITVFLGRYFGQRSWCRICPFGTISKYIAKLGNSKRVAKHITFNKAKCVGCKICNKACPMEVDVLKYSNEGKVSNGDCIKCNICVDKCPRKSLYVA